MVADIEELEILDASEIHVCRRNAKEVLIPNNNEHYIFPIADGTVKLSGRDEVFKKNPPRSRITLNEAKTITMIFEENRKGLNHWTREPMTVKPETIFGRSLGKLHSSSSR